MEGRVYQTSGRNTRYVVCSKTLTPSLLLLPQASERVSSHLKPSSLIYKTHTRLESLQQQKYVRSAWTRSGISGGVAKLKECNHRFCHDCIFGSLQYTTSKGHKLTCPMCRAATSMSSIRQCVKRGSSNEEEEFVRPASFFFKMILMMMM